jgi:hypothetical protein
VNILILIKYEINITGAIFLAIIINKQLVQCNPTIALKEPA